MRVLKQNAIFSVCFIKFSFKNWKVSQAMKRMFVSYAYINNKLKNNNTKNKYVKWIFIFILNCIFQEIIRKYKIVNCKVKEL